MLDIAHADPTWPAALTARITLGMAIAHEQSDEAAEHLHQALKLAREDGHKHNEAWCLNCLGVALRQMGRYEEALAHEGIAAVLDETDPAAAAEHRAAGQAIRQELKPGA
ncbi:tetratricopeptide repeat protein [Streptosporangium sp. NPDC002544]|uniref:tetratricopeptide repeat protein n=1 Tax=Streptosporangium sp. NPDC002544 TaxID=3154538 RepID=UPI0033216183